MKLTNSQKTIYYYIKLSTCKSAAQNIRHQMTAHEKKA